MPSSGCDHLPLHGPARFSPGGKAGDPVHHDSDRAKRGPNQRFSSSLLAWRTEIWRHLQSCHPLGLRTVYVAAISHHGEPVAPGASRVAAGPATWPVSADSPLVSDLCLQPEFGPEGSRLG